MKLLFVNSGLDGIPEGYSGSIINSLIDDYGINLREVRPQCLTYQIIDEFKPDWLFVFHGNLTRLSTIRYARKKGILTFLWIVEDPYELDVHTKKWINTYNYIFTNEIRTIPYYNSSNVFYLPWCTSLNVYKPQTVSEKYQSDLCFVGMGFENRVEILNQLEDTINNLNVKLIGNWSEWGRKELKRALRRFVLPTVTAPEEVAKYYNGAKINLNIHRDPYLSINVNKPRISADSLNNRLFDIAGTGSFQIVDNTRSELSKFYTPDEEIIVFNSADELKMKIKYYLEKTSERKKIETNAYFKTLTYHTFKSRLKLIFYNCLDGKLIKGESPEIYFVKDKKKHHIISIEAFMSNGFIPNSEINVSPQIVSIFSEGMPIA